MGRIMALDVGEKTIGIAFSDETQTLAFPGETIWRQAGKKRDMAALRQLVAEREVREIVVGMPLTEEGERSPQTASIEAFIATLRNHVRIPIRIQDERLTTWEAEQALMAARVPREQWKSRIDSMAASLILQTYLNCRQRAATPSRPEVFGDENAT